jgi:hypothetical protein
LLKPLQHCTRLGSPACSKDLLTPFIFPQELENLHWKETRRFLFWLSLESTELAPLFTQT